MNQAKFNLRNLEINGNRIAYVEQGEGMPVVLLHGFPLDHRMWEQQIAALSGRYRVIAPDLRGFGASTSRGPFSLVDLADDVHSLMTKLGADPCVLASLSMGGYVSQAFAAKYPQSLRGLVLVDTKALADTSEGKQQREKMIGIARASGSAAIGEQMLPKLVAESTLSGRPEVVSAVRAMAAGNSALTLEHALAAMRDRPDRMADNAAIRVPTLVIVGEKDSITPPEIARQMQEAIPGARLKIIAGAGHLSPMEASEDVTAALEQFIGSIGR